MQIFHNHLPQHDTYQSFAENIKYFNKQACCFAHREKRFGHFPVDDLKKLRWFYLMVYNLWVQVSKNQGSVPNLNSWPMGMPPSCNMGVMISAKYCQIWGMSMAMSSAISRISCSLECVKSNNKISAQPQRYHLYGVEISVESQKVATMFRCHYVHPCHTIAQNNKLQQSMNSPVVVLLRR